MDTPFDSHALIARLRAGDPDAIEEAFKQVFGSEQGRLVLAVVASEAGVGCKYGGAADKWSLGYHMGAHDLAIDLITRAGFDPASATVMTMTGQLEGRDDEPSALPERDVEDDPEWT